MRGAPALGAALLLLAACGPKGSGSEPPLFYYDLGPATVDVRDYPEDARKGYTVFLAKCSLCHSPARAINAPYLDPRDWASYLARMRWHSGLAAKGLMTEEERAQLQTFLRHDTLVRKKRRKAEFFKEQEGLKRLFRAGRAR